MTSTFYKYQGTGNDFIILDDRDKVFDSTDVAYIEQLCNRRFGIGADGLILLQLHETEPYKMVYFNSDGRESSMCGNGGRCFAQFIKDLGLEESGSIRFTAIDGLHLADISQDNIVKLKMQRVPQWELYEENTFILDTGSPHFVCFKDEMLSGSIVDSAREIRYNQRFAKDGINVNFAVKNGANLLDLRTYERGVEDETYSCGTGATATALAANISIGINSPIKLNTPGGMLTVYFDRTEKGFENIWLEGPATFVFSGNLPAKK